MLWPRLARNLVSKPLTERAAATDEAVVEALAERLRGASRARLGRSLAVRQVDAGSCNGCELEIHMLSSVVYDLERYGLSIVASPRHADVLLVTGPVTRNLAQALAATHAAVPDPKWVVALGDCAADGGVFKGSAAVVGGVADVVPVDLLIPGCPPAPARILEGLLALMEVEAR